MKYLIPCLLIITGCDKPPVQIHSYGEAQNFNYDCVMRQGKNGHIFKGKDGKTYGVCDREDSRPEDILFNS